MNHANAVSGESSGSSVLPKDVLPPSSSSQLDQQKLSSQTAASQNAIEDNYVDQDADIFSSIEKLSSASQALAQFASNMRSRYALDDVELSSADFADVDLLEDGAKGAAQHQIVSLEDAEKVLQQAQQQLEQQQILHKALLDKVDALQQVEQVEAVTASTGDMQPAVERQRPVGGLPGKGLFETVSTFFKQTAKQPEVFTSHYTNFAKEMFTILQARSELAPERADKRFRDAVWRDNVFYRMAMQTYLAWDKEVAGWVDDLDMDEADRRRARFIYEQFSALLAPTNSPLNPVAVKRAYQTGGKSVLDGLANIVDDIKHNHAMPCQIRSDAFNVGTDLACSEGAVVYRCEILELIQYKMEPGQKLDERPVLIVPPQLNKFYVFDLTPKNSIVKQLQSQGVEPFIISWRNPSRHQGHWDLDLYVIELENAINAMRDITGADQINLTSACAGGLTSMALLGYLQAANKPIVHSHSLFVTALQADDSFSLALFATREGAELSRKMSAKVGYMDGKTLSHIFNWLRPTDLVWNYWINNYLLGKEPPSMDVLYWDNDSTRLPAGLHSDFLDIFIEDAFAKPGTLTVKGYPIDISKIAMDFYCVGGDEDYLMPWKKCFEVPELVESAKCTFVLSTSGHIQSILRPPGIANTFYYVNDSDERNPDKWLASASKEKGSWWDHWCEWLHDHSSQQRTAPEKLGSANYPALAAAPGLYVNEKVS